MEEVLKKTGLVADVAARLAPRSHEPARRPPRSGLPAHAMPTHTPPTGPPVLGHTTHEAARISGICRSLLYREIAAGRLIARKQGRRTIILDDDLRAFLASLPRMPTSGDAAVARQNIAVAGRDGESP
jgi:hypothetical protein